jgi:hypothetical protein
MYEPLKIGTVYNAVQLRGTMSGSVEMYIMTTGSTRAILKWVNGVFSFTQVSNAGYQAQAYLERGPGTFSCGCVDVRLYTDNGTVDLQLENFSSTTQSYYIDDSYGFFFLDSDLTNRYTNGGQTNCPPTIYNISETVDAQDAVVYQAINPLTRYDLTETVDVQDAVTIEIPEDLLVYHNSSLAISDNIEYILLEDPVYNITDAIHLSDAVVTHVYAPIDVNKADTLSVSDTPDTQIKESQTYRAFAETATVSDIPNVEISLSQNYPRLEDEMELRDTVNILTLQSDVFNLQDTADVSDGLNILTLEGRERDLEDNISTTDNLSLYVLESGIRHREDSVTLGDDVIVLVGSSSHLRLADSVTLQDAVFVPLGEFIYTLSDTVHASETRVMNIYTVSRIPKPPTVFTPEQLEGVEVDLYKTETEIDFNPENVFELIYVNLKQLWTNLKEYTFGAILNFPAEKHTDLVTADETELLTFVGENTTTFYEPYTDADIFDYSVLNGINTGKDIEIEISPPSADKPDGMQSPADTASASDTVSIEILPNT